MHMEHVVTINGPIVLCGFFFLALLCCCFLVYCDLDHTTSGPPNICFKFLIFIHIQFVIIKKLCSYFSYSRKPQTILSRDESHA
jgi:hypothetical protein